MAKRRKKRGHTRAGEKVQYRLYACDMTEENILTVQSFRFYRITAKYILLYYGGHRIIHYNEIKDDDLRYLSYEDKRWLLDCNMAIIAEETEKHKDSVAANMGLKIERLEQALKAEQAKVNADDRQSESEK